MSDPQPGIHRPQSATRDVRRAAPDASMFDPRAQLRQLYARHFAVVQRLEARRLAAANRRIARTA